MRIRSLNAMPLLLALFFMGNAAASDINNGRGLYQRHCAKCHGANGRPTMAGAADFSRGQGLMNPDQALLKRIRSGDKACPAYFGILREQEIFDVIAYIRTLP